jgi:hypothetical protein
MLRRQQCRKKFTRTPPVVRSVPKLLNLQVRGTVFLTTAKSRMLKPLAFDEYCRFDISAFF